MIGEGADNQEDSLPAGRWYVSRRFAILWSGTLLSSLGDMIFEFTLIVWALQRYGESASWLIAGILVASSIPTIVLGPIAGTLVDQWHDKIRVVLLASSAIAILTLLLAPLLTDTVWGTEMTLPTSVQLGVLLFTVFIISALNRFIQPATGVISRDIVADADRPRAASLNQVAQGTAILVGPPMAAPLFVSFGLTWALALNAASFVACAVLVRLAGRGATLESTEPDAVDQVRMSLRHRIALVRTDLVLGIGFFRQSPTLMTLAGGLLIALSGFGALNTLDPSFVVFNLGGSADIYGWFGTAQGAGSLIGAALFSVVVGRVSMPTLFCASLAGLGLLTLVYAHQSSVPAGLALIFLLGLLLPAINIAVSPIMLQVTPRAYLGRVGGTLNPLINVATMAGVLIGGVVYGLLGESFSVTIGGVRFGALDSLLSLTGMLSMVGGLYAWRRFRTAAVRAELESAAGSRDAGFG